MNLAKKIERKKQVLQEEIDALRNQLFEATKALSAGRSPNPLGIIQRSPVDRLCAELGVMQDLNLELEIENK